MAYDFEKAKQRAADAGLISINLVEAYLQGVRNNSPSGRPWAGPTGMMAAGFAELLRHELELYYAELPKKPLTETARLVDLKASPAADADAQG